MLYTIVTRASHLEIKLNKPNTGFDIGGLILSSTKDVFPDLFGNSHFRQLIGDIDFKGLADSTFLIAKEKHEGAFTRENAEHILEHSWGPIQLFQIASWIVKDNNINFDCLFLYLEDKKQTFRNRRNIWNTNSEGVYSNTLFNEDELNDAVNWEYTLLPYLLESYDESNNYNVFVGGNNEPTYRTANPHLVVENRFSRCLDFIRVARSESFLPVKIASYIGALESLFDIAGELSHQVSERTAKLLSGDITTRVKNYNIVKEAYDIRSKYVHGSLLSKKHRSSDKLKEVSRNLDEILRQLIQLLLKKYPELAQMKKEELTEWYKKLILG